MVVMKYVNLNVVVVRHFKLKTFNVYRTSLRVESKDLGRFLVVVVVVWAV